MFKILITLILFIAPGYALEPFPLEAEWESYHRQNPGFDLEKLRNAAEFAFWHYRDQERREGQSSQDHVQRLVELLWKEGKVRNVNVLIAGFLDHIEETGVSDEEIAATFGTRVLQTLNEDHPPTKGIHEHRQAHLDLAPTQSINAQILQLAHQLESIRYKARWETWSKEESLAYLTWNQQMLDCMHGANPYLEKAINQEIRSHLRRLESL